MGEGAREKGGNSADDTTSSDDGNSSLDGEDSAGGRGSRPQDIPTHIMGQYVQWELRDDDPSGDNYIWIRIGCNNPAHGR